MSFYDPEELASLGISSIGSNVRISRKASIYGADRIAVGDNVRIDDFCILSAGEGGIDIGSYVHIAAYTSLIGGGRIVIADFANLSSRVSVYSSSDDYSGRTMSNPMIPDSFKAVDSRPVTIGRHVIVGSGSVVLPGVVLGESAAVGALSLVRESIAASAIVAGCPARQVGTRNEDHRDLETRFLATVRGEAEGS